MNQRTEEEMASVSSISVIYDLVGKLQSRNPKERKLAMYKIAGIGQPAECVLCQFANHPDADVRHDVADLLGRIGDPAAIPVLIEMLEDSAFAVRWRASESLIKMKREVVRPLLEELKKKERFSSRYFVEGTRHVFRKLHEQGHIGPSAKILDAFDAVASDVSIPTMAANIINILN
jgi:hypothetical protein